MITKITGKLLAVGDNRVTIAVDPFEYDVSIPEYARLQLQNQIGEQISLHTIHYIDGNAMQGRLSPRLVGFTNKVEREFFDFFCSVDGVGAKKALRAMIRPVEQVASLIEKQDAKGLSTLPGIGPATAERIIAKLRRKMPKFALLVSHDQEGASEVQRDVMQESFDVLCTLGHSEADAHKLLEAVLSTKKKFKNVESLLQAVYQQTHDN